MYSHSSLRLLRQRSINLSPRITNTVRFSSSSSSKQRPRSSYKSLVALYIAPAAIAVPAYVFSGADQTSNFTPWAPNKPAPQHPPSHLDHPMASTLNVAPGRPETLTPEQEQKLKDLWAVTLRVFGVAEDLTPAAAAAAVAASIHESDADDAATADSAEKKKKRSLGRLLSRKDKKDTPATAAEPTPAAANNTSIADQIGNLDDADDKYGHGRDFKNALATQTPAELRAAFWEMTKCDDPDGLLLRFLRARKWDVERALVMMVATMNWRAKEHDVATVVRAGEDLADEGFMKQVRMGKSFLHGHDKEGRPICVVRVRLHKQADQTEQSLERYTVYIMETARLMLRPPVDTACVIFDMTGFSLANMDYAPVKFMIKCFEAHYPESLGVCLVHKAPWVFSGIWNIIKGWLDPVVASKIHFTKTADDIAEHIPRSHILKELGGDEDWEYSYVEPVAGENKAQEDAAALAALRTKREQTVLKYEAATKAWIAATEAANGEARKTRTELAGEMARGYWGMDKFLRGRTVYDRTGVLKEDGGLEFYPVKAKGKETSEEDLD